MTVTDIETGPLDAARPWPGLDAFSESLQAYFFGRSIETEELFRRVRRDTVTLLFGQSGLGKTSLLQAGLFPRLRAVGFLPVLVRLDYAEATSSPAAQVKAALEREAEIAGAKITPIGADETLWAYFHRVDRELIGRDGEILVPVLVFDQFEEMFTLGLARDASRTASQSFLGELAELIENRPPEAMEKAIETDPAVIENYRFDSQDYRIVIAMREDFLAQLESLRVRAPLIGRNRFRLRRMNGRQGLEAVTMPMPGLIEPDLAREIVRFVGQANPEDAFGAGADEAGDGIEVEPALLSLVCRELNERRLALGLDRITPDLLAGNRESIIQSFYETALADQKPALREFVEDELLSDSGFRESVSLERARRVLTAAGVAPEALSILVSRRLLRIEERLDVARVEIIHDVLNPVIRASRDSRHLRQAESAAAEHVRELRRARRRTQFAYGAAGLMGVLLVVAAGLGYWAYRSNQRAEQNLQAAFAATDDIIANARTMRSQAGVQSETIRAMLHDAETTFNRLATIVPDSPDLGWRRAEMLIDFVHVYQDLGETAEAQRRAETARNTMLAVVAKSPNDERYEYSLARAYIAAGDTYCQVIGLCTGNYEAALKEYRAALELAKRPAVQKAEYTGWTSMRAVCDERVGDVLKQQRKFDDALASYNDALVIEKDLEQKEPNDPLWKSNLAWTYTKIAEVQALQKKFDDSLANYRESLSLRQVLVDKTPDNTEWERELSISQIDIGDVLKAQNHLDESVASYREALKIRKDLARKDPENTQLQRDLSIAVGRMGTILQLQDDIDGALNNYRDDLAINAALVRKDPSNGLWQRDLFWSEGKVGEMLRTKGDLDNALTAIEQAEKIALRLNQINPTAQSVEDLVYLKGQFDQIADLKLAALDTADAVVAEREIVAITRQLYAKVADKTSANHEIAEVLSALSWDLILDKQAREALSDCDEAHSLDPSLVFILGNRADALLLLGRFDEAKAIYLQNKDYKFSNGKIFADVVREDFATMRKFGIDTPDMHRIEALLGSS